MDSNQSTATPCQVLDNQNNTEEINQRKKWIIDTIMINGASMTVIFPAEEE